MKISIITITRNCASVLADCITSVASQRYDNIEHVLIDGASTDGTLKLLQEYRSQLDVCISEPDKGIYDAMNKGIMNSTGEIIGFLNADDFYASNNVLSSVAQCFEDDPFLEACYSDLIYVDQFNLQKVIRYWKSGEFKQGLFTKGWCPPHPTFFVRRSVYERLGMFNLTYHIAADVELMMRFLEVYQIRTKYVPDVWVNMRMGGTTNKNLGNIWIQNQEILRALNNNGLPANATSFFLNKFLSRSKQYLTKPEKTVSYS